MVEARSQRINPDAYQLPNILQNQLQLDMGMDLQGLGVGGQSNITATENQRVQKNANLKLIMNTRITMWAEKKFWGLWLRSYKANFK